MNEDNVIAALEHAKKTVAAHAEHAGDGRWLEDIVEQHATSIMEWKIARIWPWMTWPGKGKAFEGRARSNDDGIDLVGERDDGGLIAIQCKAKGKGGLLTQDDINKFIAATQNREVWAERWLLSNTQSSSHVYQKAQVLPDDDMKVRLPEITDALGREITRRTGDAKDNDDIDPRSAMQEHAVADTIVGLENMRDSENRHASWGEDEARGQVIMPCGTGKTRVGYDTARQLVRHDDDLIVVMCPSISLVRQLRLAWEDCASMHGDTLETLSVCSDASVGKVKARVKEEASVEEYFLDDPEADRGSVLAAEITGEVRGNAKGIAAWLQSPRREGARRVIFSTYQSGHHTAEALRDTGLRAEVLICDEAHRTAGIRPVTNSKKKERVRDFTICHRSKDMPARNRVYMTATPRSFKIGDAKKNDHLASKWEIRTMDDEKIFGPVCYQLSYREAVEHEYLTDYRIVAVAVPGDAYDLGNEMAAETAADAEAEGREYDVRGHTTSLAVRKLAYGLAIGGAVPNPHGEGRLPIRSSIAFCNRISRSKEMVNDLGKEKVKKWIAQKAAEIGSDGVEFAIEHRDASDGTSSRELALDKLRTATEIRPCAVSNVGIFGEGIDTPALNAIAFIEPRKSPVDVVQAVGRVMRRSPNKDLGLIIVPLAIPRGVDAEYWLESRQNNEGWEELGQVLKALRAHDSRIVTDLEKMLDVVTPTPPSGTVPHLVTVQSTDGQLQSYVWTARRDSLENVLVRVDGHSSVEACLEQYGVIEPVTEETRIRHRPAATVLVKPTKSGVLLASVNVDKEFVSTPLGDSYPVQAAAKAAEEMLNETTVPRKHKQTIVWRPPEPRKPSGKKPPAGQLTIFDTLRSEGKRAETIRVNLLEHSGLQSGPMQNFNILRQTVSHAAHLLTKDDLEAELAIQLGMDRLKQGGSDVASACTVTAVLLMTACIVHARMEQSPVLKGHGIRTIEKIRMSGQPAEDLMVAWDDILDIDYKPVFTEGRRLLRHLTRTVRKTAALDAAIRSIAKYATEIAETYATMGMDYAGELFNEVMGNQAADGAYFTRPVAAMMLAELALDTLDNQGDLDWTRKETWAKAHAFDPTCGSGSLLVAYVAAMKRRAREQGADEATLQALHKYAVERGVAGMDINPVSLQLAGAQMIIGDIAVDYQRMGLFRMPYGWPRGASVHDPAHAGSLELLYDERVVGKGRSAQTELDPATFDTYSKAAEGERLDLNERGGGGARLAGAMNSVVENIKGRHVCLTNPPFVDRNKLGSKFAREEQQAIRKRIDKGQDILDSRCPELQGVIGKGKRSTQPLYVGLGLRCIDEQDGVLGMVMPTVGLLAPSSLEQRQILANELHIRYVVTGHQPGNVNMSQRVVANESLVIGTRGRRETNRSTKFVNLQRMPSTTDEVLAILKALRSGKHVPGAMVWEVSEERMRRGDWSAAGWSDPSLDEAIAEMDCWDELIKIGDIAKVDVNAPAVGTLVRYTGLGTRRDVINSKAEDGQTRLAGRPDSQMMIKQTPKETLTAYKKREKQLWERWNRKYASHLLVCAGQNTASARVSAVMCECPTIGGAWLPVSGVSREIAKSWAVWLNSTCGRLQLLSNRGGKGLGWPTWRPAGLKQVRVPNFETKKGGGGIARLVAAYDDTSDILVPQYRDGYVEVRKAWDRAVWEAIGSADKQRILSWAEKLNRESVISPDAFFRATRSV